MNSGVPIIQPQYPLICGLAPSIPPSTSSFCAIFEAYWDIMPFHPRSFQYIVLNVYSIVDLQEQGFLKT